MKRRLSATVGLPGALAVGLLVATAACQRAASPPSAASVAPPAAPALPVPRGIRIAMIGKSSTNPVFLAARSGAEVAAKDLARKIAAPVELIWMTPPQEDAQIQAQRVAQAVRDGVNAVLISCSDSARLTPAINDAVAHGVAVMTFDSDAADSRRFSFYGVDDRALGQQLITELSRLLGGHGKVAILGGNQTAPNLRRRIEAIKEAAARHPGLQIVGTFYNVETPQDASTEVLRVHAAHPDLRGWAMVSGWALFTKTLLNELDPRRVKIVAVDALPPELLYVEKGLAPVLLAQSSFLWGNVGVTKIVDKLFYKRDVPPVIVMDPVRVTQDTLGAWARQLKQWGSVDVPEEYLNLK